MLTIGKWVIVVQVEQPQPENPKSKMLQDPKQLDCQHVDISISVPHMTGHSQNAGLLKILYKIIFRSCA